MKRRDFLMATGGALMLNSLPGMEALAQDAGAAGGAGVADRRRDYLTQLRRILPPSPPWEEWLQRSGELPPDFDTLPSRPELPDVLQPESGSGKVIDRREWESRRRELMDLFHQWVIGKVPPPPGNVRAAQMTEHEEDAAFIRQVQLTFGPNNAAKLGLELLVPKGKGPFPVFMTQHNHRGWAVVALSRGYLACVYNGADSQDDTDAFTEVYQDFDWSRLARRAWAASRCIDYLQNVREADSRRIAIAGHSRNGKMSLMASAMDPRIGVVISSSSGSGGSMPARYFSEPEFGEGIEQITRTFPEWFHPRWRFFAGREHKLPVDLHELVALTAPRACLLSTALNDGVESTWGIQQTYLAAQQVYRLLDERDNLRLMWRPGSHETWSTIIEDYLDFCDLHLRDNRDFVPTAREIREAFGEHLIHPTGWDTWRRGNKDVNKPAVPSPEPPPPTFKNSGEWERYRTDVVRVEVRRMLGQAPPIAPDPGRTYGIEPGHIASLLGRNLTDRQIDKQEIAFGEYINGDIFMPAGLIQSGKKAPAVLWLHPWSTAQGYVAPYWRDGAGPGRGQVFRDLARAGYVVFCFDQIGFGRRIEEVEPFYRRHPRWSLMGKMLRDSQSALDVLAALPYVDPKQISVLAYYTGALLGMHLGALDDRVSGLVSVAGPPPFRTDTDTSGTGGMRRWSHRYLLLPRLGLWAGDEAHVPYDTPQLLAAMAPRPVTVISPQLDRHAPLEQVTAGLDEARKVYSLYGAEAKLLQVSPDDYNHFGEKMQDLAVEQIKALYGGAGV